MTLNNLGALLKNMGRIEDAKDNTKKGAEDMRKNSSITTPKTSRTNLM